MEVNVALKDDKVIIKLNKPLDVVESYSTKIYNVKKIVIETLDVVLECFDEENKLLGSFFYRINGKETIDGHLYKEDIEINLIDNGTISEDIFKWNGCNN